MAPGNFLVNSKQIGIIGSSGDQADVIPTNGHLGLVTVALGHVSTLNSTNGTFLGIDETYVGDWEDITNFGIIVVSIRSDVVSADDGLMLEFSSDGTGPNIISDDNYTVNANSKKTFSFQAAAQYYRVVYTNGGTIQTYFNLQTVLKPSYVKPSSHRIQDSIINDDDAELVKSVLTGQDDLTGFFDNVSTYRQALNVNQAFVHRKIVNELFHQHTGVSTTLNTAASSEDTSISVVDTTGFIVGDKLKIVEGPLQEVGIITITGVSVGAPGTLTLDRPLGNDYTTAATVDEVITNMVVDGTLASPEIFEVHPPIGTVWQITRLLISLTHTAEADNSKFGSIASLTNGVALRAESAAGRRVVPTNWKNNKDMKLDMFNVEYTSKAGPGLYGTDGRWTLTTSEIVAELDGDASPAQSIQLLIQDLLDTITGLVTFEIKAQGRVFSP